MINEKLLARISNVAQELPPSLVDSIIECLDFGANKTCDQKIKIQLLAKVSIPKFRQLVLELTDTWSSDAPLVSCSAVGAMLATANYCERLQRNTSAELVWTGPSASQGGLRRTGQALLQLINEVQKELTIVSFAVYRIPDIVSALNDALDRGVKLRIIAESQNVQRASSIFDVEANFGALVMEKANVFIWPQYKRPADARGRRGLLHVKCAVADKTTLFISSANLTAHALRINMEMGILLRHPALADQVTRHIDALIAEGIFVRIR